MRLREFERARRAFAARTGHDHARHAGSARAFERGIEIVDETFVAEVGADVDQLH